MLKQLQPGDRIIGLDKNTALVNHTKSCQYNGKILEVTLKESNHTLHGLPENLVLCVRKIIKLSTIGYWDDIPEHHFQKARQLRQQTTPPEKKLWQYLRSEQLGIKFRIQHPINRYIVDFYARKVGLVVEVDGESAYTYPDQIKHDQERDKFMEALGLKVLRFSAVEVLSNIEGVISEIEYHLQEFVPDNYSSGQWRYVKNIKIGDKIFLGENLNLCQVSEIREVEMDCDVIFLDLEGSDNFISDSFVFHV